jgi:hypothetical protein
MKNAKLGGWKNADALNQGFRAALPRRADQEEMSENGLWSALQTHLQGVDGATLAMMPGINTHAQPSFHDRLLWRNTIIR